MTVPLVPPPIGPPSGDGKYFVQVSNGDIYNALISLQGQVSVLVQQGSQSAKEIVDHEARLRALEKARWPLPSLAVAVSIVAILVAAFVR